NANRVGDQRLQDSTRAASHLRISQRDIGIRAAARKERDRYLHDRRKSDQTPGQHTQTEPPFAFAQQGISPKCETDQRHLFLDEKREQQAEQERDPSLSLQEVDGETEWRHRKRNVVEVIEIDVRQRNK